MKILLPPLLFVTLFASCADDPSSRAAAENERLVRKYFDLFNRHEWEAMAGMYAEPAEFKDPSLGPDAVRQTRREIAAKYAELNGAFADIRDSIVQLYPSGDRHIVVEFVSTGTAPDGSRFELPICTVFTVENGLITKDFTYYDDTGEPETPTDGTPAR